MIKNIVFIFLSIISFCAVAQAQQTGELTAKGIPESKLRPESYDQSANLFLHSEESERAMSRGMRSSLTIELPEVDRKLVSRIWAEYTRTNFRSRSKYDRKAKEWIAAEARVPAISVEPVNLHTRTTQLGENALFTLWVAEGSAFLSSNTFPRKTMEARYILEDFYRNVEREKVNLRVAEEEKNLRKLENEYQQLQAAQERYYREIEFAEERIRKAKANIIQNEKDQVSALDRIEAQRQAVEAVRRMLERI